MDCTLKSMFKWQMKPQKIWKEECGEKSREEERVKNCSWEELWNRDLFKGIICTDLSCLDGKAKHINLRCHYFFPCCGLRRERERECEMESEMGFAIVRDYVRDFDGFNYYPEFEEGDIKGCGRLAHSELRGGRGLIFKVTPNILLAVRSRLRRVRTQLLG